MRKDTMKAFETTVPTGFPATEAALREGLAVQGFGVVSEIDVAANLKKAVGVERPPLKILGACSPLLVQEALALDPSVTLLLPCNIVLQPADGGGTNVQVVDPRLMDDPDFAELAEQAAACLKAALAHLDAHATG
jgi:uncharacterized protein (DUF302 family)